jgi:hypothetical protein
MAARMRKGGSRPLRSAQEAALTAGLLGSAVVAVVLPGTSTAVGPPIDVSARATGRALPVSTRR